MTQGKISPERLSSVQILRGIAALLVVLHHSRNPQGWLFNPLSTTNVLSSGVDMFFVISGFIIYRASLREPPTAFAKRRLIRILPMYALATIATALLYEKYGIFSLEQNTIIQLIKSILFIPYFDQAGTGIFPYLLVGWTLNYEVFFYVIVVFCLTLRINTLVLTSTAIVSFILIGRSFDIHNSAPLTFYSNPVMLEFVFGLVLSATFSSVKSPYAVLLLPLGVALLLISEVYYINRPVSWGIPYTMILAGALSLESVWRNRRTSPANAFLPVLFTRVGDASYSIYLFQFFGIAAAAWTVRHLGFQGYLQFVVFCTTAIIFASVLGLVIHIVIEKPVTRALHTLMLSKNRRHAER